MSADSPAAKHIHMVYKSVLANLPDRCSAYYLPDALKFVVDLPNDWNLSIRLMNPESFDQLNWSVEVGLRLGVDCTLLRSDNAGYSSTIILKRIEDIIIEVGHVAKLAHNDEIELDEEV